MQILSNSIINKEPNTNDYKMKPFTVIKHDEQCTHKFLQNSFTPMYANNQPLIMQLRLATMKSNFKV